MVDKRPLPGVTVACDPEVAADMKAAASRINLKPHIVGRTPEAQRCNAVTASALCFSPGVAESSVAL